MDVIIELLAAVFEKDADGIDRRKETARTVFARKMSVTREEFFSGGRNGLNPSLMFRMFAGDYSGERRLRYDGAVYKIYRTYMTNGDYIELYTEREESHGEDGGC